MKPRRLMWVFVIALLALARKVEASVVYTPVNVTISGNGYLLLDLNHDHKTDFTILVLGKRILCTTGPGSFGEVVVTPTQGNGVVSAWPGGTWAAALASGIEIDSRPSFYRAQALMTQYSTCLYPPQTNYGAWLEATNRYLGLQFQIKGQRHYGWARLTIYPGRAGPIVALTGFAYETIPGQGIKTGQISGS